MTELLVVALQMAMVDDIDDGTGAVVAEADRDSELYGPITTFDGESKPGSR